MNTENKPQQPPQGEAAPSPQLDQVLGMLGDKGLVQMDQIFGTAQPAALQGGK